MPRSDQNISRETLVAIDRKHVWRPYTSVEDHEERDPLVIARAEGSWLYDYDGRRYLDGNGSWWVNTLGHSHPRLVQALSEQAHTLAHCALADITHTHAAMLAKELCDIAPPGLRRVFYSDDGSTAVEVAIKIAFQYWQQNGAPKRQRFVCLENAFHGDTLGAVSVGGVRAFRRVFEPLLFDVIRVQDVNEEQEWEQAIYSIIELLADESDTIAGVIVEPVLQGAAGMRIWPPHLLRDLREATQRADTFLIADEVFTGLGRTGQMWACNLAQITPDLLCTAKALSGGLFPFAATLATERVFNGFRGGRSRALLHGHSYTGNPLGAAVAREVLSIYREQHILEEVRRKSSFLTEKFLQLAQLPYVERTRSIGLVGALDLGDSGYLGNQGRRVCDAARKRGVYLRPLGDTVYIAPPFTITEEELDYLLAVLEDSVREVASAQISERPATISW